MDLDANGQLSHGEVKRHLRANQEAAHLLKPPKTSWQALFAAMEGDHRDHRIDEDGFVQYYFEMAQAAASRGAGAP